MFSVRQTVPDDWLHSIMSDEEGVFCSDSDFIQKIAGVPSGGSFSYRFVGNARIGYSGFLVVKTQNLNQLDCFRYEMAAVIERLGCLADLAPGLVITCSPELGASAPSFGVFDNVSGTTEKVASIGLKDRFKNLSGGYVESPGAVKSVNRSVHDNFHLFTREFLSKYVIVNDVDCLVLEKSPIFVECKRIVSEPEHWQPYLDDRGNYMALQNLTRFCPGAITRTLVYSVKQPGKLVLHEITNVTKDHIEGMSATAWNVKSIRDLCKKTPIVPYVSIQSREDCLLR